ncbi:MAG: tripartite tricarboxylate transporter TctB family protein [Desulfobulbia bacterium]
MTRIQRDTIAYLLILAFCVLMLTWGIPKYTPPYPGYGASPALVPNVSISVILVMSLLALLRNVIAKATGSTLPPEESEFPEDSKTSGFTQIGRVKLLHLLSFMVPCALLVISIDYIGYVPAAFLFMLAIQYVIGSRNIVQSIIVSVAAVVVLYVTMRYGFGVPIPGPQLF